MSQYKPVIKELANSKGLQLLVISILAMFYSIIFGNYRMVIIFQMVLIVAFYIIHRKLPPSTKLDREKFFTTISIFITVVIGMYGSGHETLAGEILLSIAYYGILSLSLNISTGHVGVVNFGVIAQVAVGGIIFGLATLNFGVDIFLAVIYGMIGAAVFSALLASTTLRLREDYFAIVSVTLGEIIKQIMKTEPTVHAPKDPKTGKYSAFPGIIKPPTPFGDSYANFVDGTFMAHVPYRVFLGIFCCFLLALVFLCTQLLSYSPYGRVLRAIREEELSTSTYGKDLFNYRVGVFAISGAIAGLGGAILAWQLSGIYPEQLTPIDTFFAWTIIIIGGRGNNKGTIAGTIIFVMTQRMSLFLNDADIFNRYGVNDALQKIAPHAPPISMGYIQLIFVGLLIVFFLRFYPQGLIAEEPFRPLIKGYELPPPGSQADSVEVSSKPTKEVPS